MFNDFTSAFDDSGIALLVAVLIKMGVGAVLGGAIGYERELSGRPAGVRTHMLLVIGVVLFSEVSRNYGGGDPGRIAAQIVTGVGFLGAGTILRMGIEIKGLTSAASLWAAAAIGMAISVGGAFMLIAVGGTLFTLVTLAYVSRLERKLVPFAHPAAMQLELEDRACMASVIESVQRAGGKIKGVHVVTSDPLHIRIDLSGDHEKCMESVINTPGVRSSSWMD